MSDTPKRTARDPELELYRSVLQPPGTFRNGFTWVTVAGALFCGLLMMPGTIYLSLITGGGVAASWVTLIIFSEIARRAMKTLSPQELVVLLAVAGAMSAGGPAAELVWRQYLVNSQAVREMGLAGQFPSWYAPQPGSAAIAERLLFHRDWLVPILLMLFLSVVGTVRSFTLGYFFFRLTSDIEQLPFPMAGIGAQGSLALAEAGERKTTWKWRVFSLGAVIGGAFAILQIGVPLFTGAFLAKPVMIIPLPWYDLTALTEKVLPATPAGIVLALGLLLTGLIVPLWAVMGTAAGMLVTLVANPLLHRAGVLTRWQPGMDTVATTFNNSLDFWMSFGIGTALGIALISFYQTGRDLSRNIRAARQRRREAVAGSAASRRGIWATPPGRGDFPIWMALGLYVLCSLAVIGVTHLLVPKFPVYFLFFFVLLYTPLVSYIDARLQGISGTTMTIPMVREGAIILSGYKGLDIWLAPMPVDAYAGAATAFRTKELTGTNFLSYAKASCLTVPLSFALSFAFWAFIWRSGAIPSELYPYANKMWELNARNAVVLFSATLPREGVTPLFFQALHPQVIGLASAFCVSAFAILSAFKLPVLAVYGFVQSIGGMPHGFVLIVVGALIGRLYFRRKYGAQKFLQTMPVLLAGYGTGVGLIALLGVAVNLIVSAVSAAPF